MRVTPVDRVALEIPAEKRFASIVRAAVLVQACSCGVPLSRAGLLARAVSVGFRALAGKARAAAPARRTERAPRTSFAKRTAPSMPCVLLLFEKEPDAFCVRIDPGGDRKIATFRAPGRRREGGTRPARKPLKQHQRVTRTL